MSGNGSSQVERSRTHDQLVGRLALRYFLVLTAVAILVTVDQAVLQPTLIRLDGYAPVINLSGRQRMLSQKITKTALALHLLDEEQSTSRAELQAELRAGLAQWTTTQAGLRYGSNELELPGVTSSEILAAFDAMDPHVVAMTSAVEQLLVESSPNNGRVNEDSGFRDSLRIILAHEAPYLIEMDRTVRLFEAEARQRVFWLRAMGVLAMVAVLGLLAVVGLFVVRPATRLIAEQMHQLERRVAERTEELMLANESLLRESDRRLRMRNTLNERSQQLAHLSRVRALGQLASGLAHELNQPLGSIANYASLCELHLQRSSFDTETFRTAIMGVQRSALRAGEIVRRMRRFVRPDAASKCSIDLNDLVREVVELCRAETLRWNIELDVTYSVDPIVVRVDPIQIQQVLVNLLQNAIQAIGASPREIREVRMELTATEDSAVLHVRDTGPGFPGEALRELFRPFYSTKPEGLGLGLAISRSIAQEHGGELTAESSPQGGAHLTLTLPRDPFHELTVTSAANGVCG